MKKRFDWQGKKGEEIREYIKKLVLDGMRTITIVERINSAFRCNFNKAQIDNIRSRYSISPYVLEEDGFPTLYNKQICLPKGDYLVTCDYHCPYHSVEWCNRSLAVADKLGIKTLIIAGDLFEMSFAKKWLYYEDEKHHGLDAEIDEAQKIKKMLEYFDKVYLIRGNHEDRVRRMTEARIQAGHIIKLFTTEIYAKKFIYSPYDSLFIGDNWMVVHPQSYSQISGSTAVRLAEKYHRHILNSHGHFSALRYDRSGKHMGIDTGAMVDPLKVGYISLSTSTHPFWNSGFCVVREDGLFLFNKSSDWTYWV